MAAASVLTQFFEMIDKNLIFLHIPKAAGSTLYPVIGRQYDHDSLYIIDGRRTWESIREFTDLPEEQRGNIKVLMGHMSFGLHRYLSGPSTYITILREPVDRVISHYYYVLRTPVHYLHNEVMSKKMTLKDYVESGLTVELDNGQTRLICGTEGDIFGDEAAGVHSGECTREMLDRAKKNLVEYFSVVGLTERFDETLVLMKKTFGWKLPYYTMANVTKGRPPKDDIDRDTIELIEKRNELDIELYRFAKERFEKQISELGPSFEQEVRRFQAVNAVYSRAASVANVVFKAVEKLRA